MEVKLSAGNCILMDTCLLTIGLDNEMNGDMLFEILLRKLIHYTYSWKKIGNRYGNGG